MNKIKLTPTGQFTYKVELDGIDISKYVSGIEFDAHAGKSQCVKLIIPAQLELPEEIKAIVSIERSE